MKGKIGTSEEELLVRKNPSNNIIDVTIKLRGELEIATYKALCSLLPNIGDCVNWDEVWTEINPNTELLDKKAKKGIKNRVDAINKKAGRKLFGWTTGNIKRVHT
ncbi:MAG: hypothetical protein Greene041662_368 [Candidatus Peregrinibacteria bacterium Greene0416_62]|nr:MAG: hypothetical protein Greene041662_368 [Candidatus Peregrinibacteria bacterium Greene0416_62]TSC99129.1 MAG: hypothetical protein Greene101449_705 [Candidatus Peregrinibacteria bacterium Greene1014_49]